MASLFRNPSAEAGVSRFRGTEQTTAPSGSKASARPERILHTWKDIAQYMGRGVRTLQRWEHDLGMPVHRPKGKSRSAVLALTRELDEWVNRTPVLSGNKADIGPEIGAVLLDLSRDLLAECERLVKLDQRPEAEELVRAVREIEIELTQMRNLNPAVTSHSAD